MIAQVVAQDRSAKHWAPIVGRWSFDNDLPRYQGPQGGGGNPMGVALSDLMMRDGTVKLGITFDSDNFDDNRQNCAAVILGHNAQLNRYVLVQLGGWASAYSLGELDSFGRFTAILKKGSLDNLVTKRRYDVEIIQRGQTVRLLVNSVPVFEHVLAEPLPGSQIGLQAYGECPVQFHDVKISETIPRLFVAMQFSEPFESLFENVIRPVAEEECFEARKIDSIARPGIIFQDIQREISESKAVLAEISTPNNNVFYELGYSHALNKPTILLARKGQELPFDIRSYRVIFYDDSISGKPILEETLKKHLRSILQEF